MCGVFAYFQKSGPLGRSFEHHLDLMAHRGPDDRGTAIYNLRGHTEPDAWLGHRRLSIIDLSDRGRQPMESSDGRFSISFNGEIYNYRELRRQLESEGHRFATRTDTEVLLQAWANWGPACLNRLVGMFAFVILDRNEGEAFLVRDHFGIKPLHFVLTHEMLAVASEIRPLLELDETPKILNREAVFQYMRWGTTTSQDGTIFNAIKVVPPASYRRFDAKAGVLQEPVRYWRLQTTRRDSLGFHDAVQECRSRFLESVRLHLRSDVPVGAAVSGGMDSSAIVGAIRHLEPDANIHLFSYIPGDSRISEESWVDQVQADVRGTLHKVRVEPQELFADLPHLVRSQGLPFGSASIYAQYRVFQRARHAGIPVTLDGQGADELLGGYTYFLATLSRQRLRRGRLDLAVRLIASDQASPSAFYLAALVAQGILPSRSRRFMRRLIDRETVGSHLDRSWFGSLDWAAAEDALLASPPCLKEHLVQTVTTSSLPSLLRYADRNSMAWSVESRVPFLNKDFAEFLMSLPDEYLIDATGSRKHVFREAIVGLVPEPVRMRRDKVGFYADDGRWLRENHDALTGYYERLANAPFIHAAELLAHIDAFVEHGRGDPLIVWRLMIFGAWMAEHEQYMDFA